MAYSAIRRTNFGSNTGRLSLEPIKSIGVRCGAALDNIIINSKKIGGSGGNDSTYRELTLRADEYIVAINISTIDIWDKQAVSPVTFLTNKGHIIGSEFDGSDKMENYSLNNIRLIAIGAMESAYIEISNGVAAAPHYIVARLELLYIENYSPSVDADPNVKVILDYKGPNQKFSVYQEAKSQSTHDSSIVAKSMTSQSYSASVGVSYGISASVSAGLDLSEETMNSLSTRLENQLTKARKETH